MLNNNISHGNSVKMRFVFSMMFVIMGTLIAFSLNVNAATFVVNTTADTQDAAPGNGTCADANGACSLRAAITEANALAGADTITLPAGTYTHALVAANEEANAGGDFDITSPLTINGAGAATTIVQSNAAPNTATERVFHVSGAGATSVTIDGVTIQNGKALDATDGGRGGGIKVDGGTSFNSNTFTITNSTLKDNFADTRGGGITINKYNSIITNCIFTNNVAGSAFGTGGAGGAILIDSQDNVAVPTMTSVITNTVMTGNKAESTVANTFGGAVIVRAVDATVTFDGCTVNNNISNAVTAASFSGFAGGLYNQQAKMIVRNTTVSGNTTSHFHAGIRNLASTAAAATLDIIDSTISNNTSASATGQGGGVTNILGSTFDATVNIDHSTISGNTLTGATSIGGGLINTGSAGGAALLTVTNSTVSGNSAADIGGIYSDGSAATCIIDFSTVANNSATNTVPPAQGGGIFQDTTAGGSTFVSNTISADNIANIDVDINELPVSLDYNHFESPNAAFVGAANDVLTGDPGLGVLANNGGTTQTHLPGTVVRNTIPNGTNGCGTPINDDQRRQPRPFPAGGACDKGSVEFSTGGATPTNTSTFTPTPSATSTVASTPTNTATNTPANTPTNTATSTNTPTATSTTQSTPTNTATSTNTPTATSTTQSTPTNTSTATATNTATAAPSASPSCTPNNVIVDGGFESGGIPSTIWNNPQTSTNFGTALCTVAACGTGGGAATPRNGLTWAWFGGATSPETATLGQSVVIPAGTAELRFWMRIGTVVTPFTDVLNVKVDGTIVQTYAEPQAAEDTYTERVINLNAFANGALHNITFEYIGPTSGTANFSVDDVSLNAGGCPTGSPTATATASATATATSTIAATSTATSTPTAVPTPQSFSNTAAVCTTLGTTADIYPSNITVSGGPTNTGNIRVIFNNFWHLSPDNFDALLVGPLGEKYVLMGDAGGIIAINQGTPVNLTFADFQPVVLPDSGPLVTGTTEPTTWESPVTSFAAPAPPAPYIEAGNVPFGPIGTTMFGAFGLQNANGTWSLYLRDDAGAFVSPTAVSGCLDGGWTLQFLPLTAAPASISGRVLTADGQGIRNAKIVVTGPTLSEPVIVSTGSMGYYSLDGLTTGQTYIVSVISQRYTFTNGTKVLSLVDNIADADFTADPQE